MVCLYMGDVGRWLAVGASCRGDLCSPKSWPAAPARDGVCVCGSVITAMNVQPQGQSSEMPEEGRLHYNTNTRLGGRERTGMKEIGRQTWRELKRPSDKYL